MMLAASSSPVFVFGALRSGTTLFRLMLDNHPGIQNPGESDFLFDFISSQADSPTGWHYDLEGLRSSRVFQSYALSLPEGLQGIDLLQNMISQLHTKKSSVLTLNVHRHADRIAALLPEARFIHLVRDPRDVARSSIGMGWSGTSWRGLDHWLATERGWDAARIDPNKVFVLRFEDLMRDIDTSLRRLCDMLGVPFSTKMLDYHLNTTYGPPDPSIVQQWKKKATPYEIAVLEGRCADLMSARGYTLNGKPIVPKGIERVRLNIVDRMLRWRFNIRRFGLSLFVLSHLSRHLRLKRLDKKVRARMNAKSIELLK